VPPTFTDRGFHNTGVTQEEFDSIHGSGSFAKLDVPLAGTRPLDRFQKRTRRNHPGETDLGYWNFARYGNSPMYVPQEAESEFRARTIATFKTPPLRNLPSTPPYMHNGNYTSIESTLQQKVEAAFLARMGDLRNADPELSAIRIMENDFPALFAFLNALCDEGTRTAEFQYTRSGDSRVAPNSAYNYKPD
jgi:cytochrome c peroxidase